jgi:Flp pilus assembly protein TadG
VTRGRQRSRGQSLAEFALAIPLFFLVFLGVAEGGYYVVATTIVSHATQEGARLGVLESTASREAVRTRVQQQASPVVTLAASAINLHLDKEDGTVRCSPCNNNALEYPGREPGDRLLVRTNYTHTPLVGYVFPGLTFPANAEAELLVEGHPSP